MTLQWLVVALVAYLLGSIPSGLLIGRVIFGVDVRQYGSGRTGATNVLRTLGAKAASGALLMDIAKGIAAVAIAQALLPSEPWSHVVAALAAMAGHNWPIFAGFHGGRGVVVGAAALVVMHPLAFLACCVVGIPLVWWTRYVSVGSIGGAVTAPLAALYLYSRGELPFPYLVYAVVGGILVVASHKANIERLRAGTENRLGQRTQTAA